MRPRISPGFALLLALLLGGSTVSCITSSSPGNGSSPRVTVTGGEAPAPILLVIDEDSIDNGNAPNGFSDVEVNDNLAEIGLRSSLDFFRANVGGTIDLFTGDVGDEGWHALRTIPAVWSEVGPTASGTRNYLVPGPGLGSRFPDDDREVLLDQIPDVTPLRAEGLAMLRGHTVLAVVYDSDVAINYGPLSGNLMGANLGIVALEVLDVRARRDASTGSLPRVTVRILDADAVAGGDLFLFENAPVPPSSSEPYDVIPPDEADLPVLVPAR